MRQSPSLPHLCFQGVLGVGSDSETEMKRLKLSVSMGSSLGSESTPSVGEGEGVGSVEGRLVSDYLSPSSLSSQDLSPSYCWESQLSQPDSTFLAAPVSAFKHAPMSEGWDNIIVEMKVENSDAEPIPGIFSTAY